MICKYKIAPFDKMTWIVTISVLVLLGFVTYTVIPLDNIIDTTTVFILLSIWLPILIVYAFSPRGYTVSEQGITIHRVIGSINIPKTDINSIDVVKRIYPGIRLAASGGLFGYFGVFTLKSGGSAKVYVTRWNCVVLVKTNDETFIISPSEPEDFCKVLETAFNFCI